MPKWTNLARLLGDFAIRDRGRWRTRVVAVGLFWLMPGTVFCLIAAVLNAWVLLVEIVR